MPQSVISSRQDRDMAPPTGREKSDDDGDDNYYDGALPAAGVILVAGAVVVAVVAVVGVRGMVAVDT
jgi:hypothetical protein